MRPRIGSNRHPQACHRRAVCCAAFLLLILDVMGAPKAAHASSSLYYAPPEQISVGLSVMFRGYAKVLGLFRQGSARFLFDPESRMVSRFTLVLDAGSLDFSNVQHRQDWLSADMLAAAQFPEIVLSTANTPQSVTRQGGPLEGTLSLRGTTKPVTAQIRFNKAADVADSQSWLGRPDNAVGLSMIVRLRRSDFGFDKGLDKEWFGNELEMVIEIEATRQD
ncbi:MAG: YceI family protein [Alphaproteobacteria bacterium]|nr:MAG: YceI family protein [Alphaproteobacteria bacterium]